MKSFAEQGLSPKMNGNPREAESFPWMGKLLRHWAMIRLGHEAVMLDRVQRVQRCAETLARNAMTGNMEDVSGWPDDEGKGMGVRIGDQYHYYQQRGMGTLGKVALAAALLGAGGGLGIGVPWLLSPKQDESRIESPSPQGIDTTRRIDIDVIPGKD